MIQMSNENIFLLNHNELLGYSISWRLANKSMDMIFILATLPVDIYLSSYYTKCNFLNSINAID